jgi:ATP-dependent exoDNAse (exonuclease V) beta subunit
MNTHLKSVNPHERDSLIKFYTYGHRYEILSDMKSRYTSVTTWIHTHFPKFNADEIIQKMFSSKSWGPQHKYWGMTADEIKASWKNSGQSSCIMGTNLHEKIELFMNNLDCGSNYLLSDLLEKNKEEENLSSSIELQYFLKFAQDYQHLKPYRTEWMIFDEELKIAGSIDMVFENEDGTLSIYDWKRCKEINQENTWNKFSTNEIISHLPDTNYCHYSLQLNTYKEILERKYGKQVKELYLVKLHPDDPNNSYELIEVPILSEEINNLFQQRIEKL